ncbi:hypothetical protein HOY82DRAFT_620041 [Tuber indicum]|nr:hypothetical protein HOY82DRAFT_620041 [Tuber indicum]
MAVYGQDGGPNGVRHVSAEQGDGTGKDGWEFVRRAKDGCGRPGTVEDLPGWVWIAGSPIVRPVHTFLGVVRPATPKKTDYEPLSVPFPEEGRTGRLGTQPMYLMTSSKFLVMYLGRRADAVKHIRLECVLA